MSKNIFGPKFRSFRIGACIMRRSVKSNRRCMLQRIKNTVLWATQRIYLFGALYTCISWPFVSRVTVPSLDEIKRSDVRIVSYIVLHVQRTLSIIYTGYVLCVSLYRLTIIIAMKMTICLCASCMRRYIKSRIPWNCVTPAAHWR
jgi:hypothetical protein